MLPRTHAIFAGVLGNVFADLDLTAALTDGVTWYPLYNAEPITTFELAHGVERRRHAYNARCLAKIKRDRQPLLGEHSGFFDFFVPISDGSRGWGALVTGPFALARPSSSEILTRFRHITGHHGHASDPEFLHYVSATLKTPTFSPSELETFQRLLEILVELLAGRGDCARMEITGGALRAKLSSVRFADRMWDSVRSMIDERTSLGWRSPTQSRNLLLLGAEQSPAHAVVGLLLGRASKTDPIDDLIRRDAFLRACVDWAKRRDGVLCGRSGDHGVILLVDDASSGARVRTKLAA
ncbi:MAG TPA: hypothetical protein VGP93_13855, partial [Polyangiaceae bacterium]|nr:hypothetical protein [Polyangiaceae bacterium]